MTRILYASVIVTAFLMSCFIPSVFAQTSFQKIEGDELKTNPISKDILAKIDLSKKEFLNAQEAKKIRDAQQKLIDEQRLLAKQSLESQLARMEKTYEEFTPRNAFTKYVSKLNATNYDIFWDQFDYLQAKISIAREARDSVLNNGGSYHEAMKQYIKYANMPKIEMQSIIKELNIKHNLAQVDIQSYFDANGKLPRYENDLDSPCYGCDAKISKLQINADQSIPITRIGITEKPSHAQDLRNSLSELQKAFLKSKDVIEQKKIVSEMNTVVKQLQNLG